MATQNSIHISTGNLLDEKVNALVNTVNCVGVMGRGIALQFRKAFPENYSAYKAACDRDEVSIGKMFVVDLARFEDPRIIINFPTKIHWRGKSKLEFIEQGLQDLIKVIEGREIASIAVPPLGCGLGGLEWSEVRPLIEEALSSIDGLDVRLFAPAGSPKPTKMPSTNAPPRMTPGRAVLLLLLMRYLNGLMDPFVSLLEVHKLMYFMQKRGEPLKLNFDAGHYGPYAQNLRHVLIRIDNHFITGYGDGHDDPDRPIRPEETAVRRAEEYLEDSHDIQERLEEVSKLIDGYETPFGMELLSTVHWIASGIDPVDTSDVAKRVHEWSERKQQFSDGQIQMALKRLQSFDWV